MNMAETNLCDGLGWLAKKCLLIGNIPGDSLAFTYAGTSGINRYTKALIK